MVKIITIIRDFTNYKRAEQELLKLQKLESLALLAGGIAHDFNNILSIVLGNISLAKMLVQPDSEIAEALHESANGIAIAKGLTNQLLSFAQGESPDKCPIDMADLLKKSVVFALHGSHIAPLFKISEGLYNISADKSQIQQVFHNLVLNARDAMDNCGTLEVSASNIKIGQVNTYALKSGKYIKISIKDTGIGISKDNQKKIFDPYFSTKSSTGLGLASTFAIIKRHLGYITVESQENKGTTFDIYLPTCSEKTTRKFKKDTVAISVDRPRILVMDDNARIRSLVARMLDKQGYDTECVADGKEAVRMYKKASEEGRPFDAVILDLIVKGAGATTTAQQLLQYDSQAKLIVCSGYAEDAIMIHYEKYGFKNRLPKPFSADEIQEVLCVVLREQ